MTLLVLCEWRTNKRGELGSRWLEEHQQRQGKTESGRRNNIGH
jgi:hypothetical protein